MGSSQILLSLMQPFLMLMWLIPTVSVSVLAMVTASMLPVLEGGRVSLAELVMSTGSIASTTRTPLGPRGSGESTMSKSNGKPVLRVLQGQEAKDYLKKQRRKADSEFKEWKKELCKIVNNQSRLIFNRDGTYQFILPSRLVKLVWSTTLQERIKAELAGEAVSLEDAKGRAINRLKEEMNQAHKEFTEAPEKQSEEEAKQAEQEEEQAKADLAKLREEMIKQRESE